MTTTLEREIKLRFASPADARAAILATGATPFRARRLQEDCLLDTADGRLRGRRSILRIRMECGKSLITFKGPAAVGGESARGARNARADGPMLIRISEELGSTRGSARKLPVSSRSKTSSSRRRRRSRSSRSKQRTRHRRHGGGARPPAERHVLDSYRGLFADTAPSTACRWRHAVLNAAGAVLTAGWAPGQP
jgi:hypothetical protein